MTDLRYKKLAKLLVNYSTQIKKGDHVLLDMIDVPDEFSIELMRAVRAAGGTPLVEVHHTRISREMVREIIIAGRNDRVTNIEMRESNGDHSSMTVVEEAP